MDLSRNLKGAVFEAANPDVEISVEPQVWDQLTPKFLAAHRAGNAPDLVWANTDLLGDALETGSLADLGEPFADKWPAAMRWGFGRSAPFGAVHWTT